MAIIEEQEQPPSSGNSPKEKQSKISAPNKFLIKSKTLLITFLSMLKGASRKLLFLIHKFGNSVRDLALNNKFLPHFVVIFLLLLVLLSNLSESARASSLSQDLIYIDPDVEASIVEDIDPYTEALSGDSNLLDQASSPLVSNEGFMDNVSSADTQITQRVEPLPDNSSSTVYYVVKQGDTLTSLGWKFGVKLATLKYVNNIDDANTIKPGVRLEIPPKGYQVAQSLIDKREKAKIAVAQRSTVSRNTSTNKRSYSGDYSGDAGGNLIVPINHNGISRGLGRGHTGIDYRAYVGTSVVAAADGVVIQTSTGWSGGYGIEIVLSHGGGIATRYAHLSQVSVSPGQSVSQGQTIGLSGNSGRSTGPHLHFEKIVNGRFVNPF